MISSPPAACSVRRSPRTAAPNLLEVVGRAIVNDTEVGRGTGADVLGHPHNALAWLANHLAEEGKGCTPDRSSATGTPGQDRVAQRRRQRGDGARRARHGGGELSGLSGNHARAGERSLDPRSRRAR